MRDDVNAGADADTQEQLERNEEVAESAAPQGDGVPDDQSVTESEGRADAATRELEEQRDKYLRLAAEYDNFRKRTARERQDTGSRAQAELAKQLIDALDDLARVAHVDPAATDTASVVQGVELVERKLLKALGGAGLEIVNPVDQTFDPTLHEAVATVPALSKEDDHTVAQVYQPGYVFKGQLLRPARVVVKQWNG